MPFSTCRGRCDNPDFKEKFVATKIDYPESYYSYGCGRCTACELFFVPGIVKCPCCGRKIKVRPRLTKDRIKYIEYQFARY